MAEETVTTKVLMEEKRVFKPPDDLVENSNVWQWMKKKGFTDEREMRNWTYKNYVDFWDDDTAGVFRSHSRRRLRVALHAAFPTHLCRLLRRSARHRGQSEAPI